MKLSIFKITFALVAVGFVWASIDSSNVVFGQRNSKVEIPEPEDMVLKTRDRVNLHCTYFPPVHLESDKPDDEAVLTEEEAAQAWGRQVIPWILIHDWQGSRRDLFAFAEELQKRGSNAVIIPDLRGHGGSTVVDGRTELLDATKFRKQEHLLAQFDIEACKRFLVQKNNESQLNIDLLNLVVIGETAQIGMAWAIDDWFFYPPFSGTIKQAQDVKTLTLISPRRRLANHSINNQLKHPMFSGKNPQIPNLPTLIMWGEDDLEADRDANHIVEIMSKGRPDLSRLDEDEQRRWRTLYSITFKSRATGTELIRTNLDMRDRIVRFVAAKVGANRENHPWQDRSKKD